MSLEDLEEVEGPEHEAYRVPRCGHVGALLRTGHVVEAHCDPGHQILRGGRDKGFSGQGRAEYRPPEVSPACAVCRCAYPLPEMSSVPFKKADPSATTPELVYHPVSITPGTSDRSRQWLVTGLRWAVGTGALPYLQCSNCSE